MFRDSDGLKNALLAGDQDLLDMILANPIVAEGNLSYLSVRFAASRPHAYVSSWLKWHGRIAQADHAKHP